MNSAIGQWLQRAILIHFPIAKVRLVALPKDILDTIVMDQGLLPLEYLLLFIPYE